MINQTAIYSKKLDLVEPIRARLEAKGYQVVVRQLCLFCDADISLCIGGTTYNGARSVSFAATYAKAIV